MDEPIKNYWQIRLTHVKKALEGNNFEVFLVENAEGARKIILEEILPKIEVKKISRGDSLTFEATGLHKEFRDDVSLDVIDPFEEDLSDDEAYERCRQALYVDLFFTGTNAVTETGKLVNLDGWGNRVAGLTFGPKYVVLLVGRNKIVPDVDEAMFRVRDYAAPINAMRWDYETPCVKTSFCEDCKSPQRICSTWTITERSFPKGRVKVILINEEFGF
jgi:L-lactate utilization protein LutB